MSQRFVIRFDPDAVKEYESLDGSVVSIVDKAIDELKDRADEVGKPLGNKRNQRLAGCKEIKFRDAGIRIIFRISNEKVDVLCIVYVLAISRRDKDQVFGAAASRLIKTKKEGNLQSRRIDSKKKK